MPAHPGALKNCFGGTFAVDMRTTADARATEDEHIVQVFDPLNPVQLCRGEPQIVLQFPVGLRNVFVFPAPASLHDANPVALLSGTERGYASAEPGADDQNVVVEGGHELFPSRLLLDSTIHAGPVGSIAR